MTSIASRVYINSFLVSFLATLAMILTVIIANENLEKIMLNLDFTNQRDFILGQHESDKQLDWETNSLIAKYVPNSISTDAISLPDIFEIHSGNHTEEIQINGRDFLINVYKNSGGTLYMARDITLFEENEATFTWIVIIASIILMGISFLLALISSRRLTQPLSLLSQKIQAIPIGKKIPKIQLKLKYTELYAISDTFNSFLTEIENFMRREHSLINLASHELRTPVAVILGAIEILKSRKYSEDSQEKIFNRIQNAAEEMNANTQTMLKLARRESIKNEEKEVLLSNLINEVLTDLKETHDINNRICFTQTSNDKIITDIILAKMLFRNLIQNALQHTNSQVNINIDDTKIVILDSGNGFTKEQLEWLKKKRAPNEDNAFGGLGLYIVTLICERMDWPLSIMENDAGGTTITIDYRKHHYPLS